jgi:hypothetical protein
MAKAVLVTYLIGESFGSAKKGRYLFVIFVKLYRLAQYLLTQRNVQADRNIGVKHSKMLKIAVQYDIVLIQFGVTMKNMR